MKIAPLQLAPPPPPLALPDNADLSTIRFFWFLNTWLRDNPRLPGEEALMAQFDAVGIGPQSRFDQQNLSPATRRGLEAGLQQGRRLIDLARLDEGKGWTKPTMRLGEYGYDYLQRAAIEFGGLHANMPAEALYLRTRVDANGEPLTGAHRYRLVLPPSREPLADAFWSLTAYDADTRDLIPNKVRIYAIGDRSPNLRREADGSVVIFIQKDRPLAPGANWLPVGNKQFYLLLRFYQPRPAVRNGAYQIAEVTRAD